MTSLTRYPIATTTATASATVTPIIIIVSIIIIIDNTKMSNKRVIPFAPSSDASKRLKNPNNNKSIITTAAASGPTATLSNNSSNNNNVNALPFPFLMPNHINNPAFFTTSAAVPPPSMIHTNIVMNNNMNINKKSDVNISSSNQNTPNASHVKSSTNANGEGVVQSPSKQKRPLPAGVSAKNSTLPTPTIMGANVLDEILGEASDLLNAAAEAQALGRLKTASSYLLLAHARLVGLGKRFDLVASLALKQPPVAISLSSNNTENTDPSYDKDLSKRAGMASKIDESSDSECNAASSTTLLDDDVALQLMSKLLPNGVKLDKAMLEHLAKSALELHKKRSGKRSTARSTEKDNVKGIAVAWTTEEHEQCVKLNAEGKNVEVISKSLKTKSVAQVRAHLRVESEKERANAPLDLQLEGNVSVEPDSMGENVRKGKNTNNLSKQYSSEGIDRRKLTRFNAKEMIMGKGILNGLTKQNDVQGKGPSS